MNTFNHDDPRITAYALGELHGAEAAHLEAQLASDAQLRAAVDEIRQTASLLTDSFAAEPAPGLTDQQRQMIETRPEPAMHRPLVFRARTLWIGAGLAAAACLTVTTLVVTTTSQRLSSVAIHKHPEFASKELPSATTAKDEQAQGAAAFSRSASNLEKQNAAVRGAAPAINSLSAGQTVFETSDQLKPASSASNYAVAPSPGNLGGRAGGSDGMAPNSPAPDIQTRQLIADNPQASGDSRSDAFAHTPNDPTGMVADRNGRMKVAPAGAEPGRAQSVNPATERPNRENYSYIADNEFKLAADDPISTFSIDVDTASYANVRRFISGGQLPPKDAVRIEEMINSFAYNYEPASGETPFSATVEVGAAPWNPEHRLLRIGLKAREIKPDMRPATSLVFLIDVSGSMNDPKKLPLVKQSLKLLVDQLNGDDRIAIVTYAGNAGLALDSTYCDYKNKPQIAKIIDGLAAGGSTNGAGGIVMAYDKAMQYHIKGGVNRVILCTDGDFNVGVSSESELVRLIEDKRATGTYLSVLGFGTGNYQDAKMKQLSMHGNGNYAYIDSSEEGRKVLVDQMCGTLVTIAKDVKVQLDFNPGKVGSYRLIGYENRVMANEDFANDRKDAGEIGAGHTVTALYEMIPASVPASQPDSLHSEFMETGKLVPSDLTARLKIRYKDPDGEESKEIDVPIADKGAPLDQASSDFRFAAAVASFGMVLRDSQFKGNASYEAIAKLAESSIDANNAEPRAEFVDLVRQAQRLAQTASTAPAQPTHPDR